MSAQKQLGLEDWQSLGWDATIFQLMTELGATMTARPTEKLLVVMMSGCEPERTVNVEAILRASFVGIREQGPLPGCGLYSFQVRVEYLFAK